MIGFLLILLIDFLGLKDNKVFLSILKDRGFMFLINFPDNDGKKRDRKRNQRTLFG